MTSPTLALCRIAAIPGTEPERRARETRRVRLPGQLEDRDRVGQRAGDRLVDEHRLVCLEDGPRLFEVRPAVDALQQHDVDLRQQLVDRADDRHPELVAQVLGVARHPVAARRDVRAAAGIGRHDANAGQLGLRARGVQELRERDHVRGIQADDAGSEGLGR